MPMTLYFKRAKSFVHQAADSGTKRFLAQPGPSPQPVPFWVAQTETFKRGVKDGSIVNLAPAEQMPGYKHPAPAKAEEPVQPASDIDVDDNDGAQQSVPQAPFGGQPLTPVQPAPKVGGVTGNSKKGK